MARLILSPPCYGFAMRGTRTRLDRGAPPEPRLVPEKPPGLVDRQHRLVLAELFRHGDSGKDLGGQRRARSRHDRVGVRDDEGLVTGAAGFERLLHGLTG